MTPPSPTASASPPTSGSALRPHAFLTFAFVCMAFNVIVGRAVHEDVPPVGLSFWRWSLASILFLPFSLAALSRQRRLIRANWKIILPTSVVMILLGNTLVYVGLQSTTALNGGLIPVSRPVIILILAWLLFRGSVGGSQWLGIAVALAGVALVLTRGDLSVIRGFRFNEGDLWLIASSIGIASYQVLVARVPRTIDQRALLQCLITLGAVMLLPLYVWETSTGRPMPIDWPTAGAVLYVAVFPSIIAVYLINIGIRALGPARAGVYNYLQPLFVAILAVPLLDEEIHWYHPVALALVIVGIVVSSRTRAGG